MGKQAKHIIVRLNSTEGTGEFYTTTKNPRTEKIKKKKYDKKKRKHVMFEEGKIK